MATRMEKYKKNEEINSRSNRNKNLYGDIYTYDHYSNIEGVADIEHTNQVDINKVKELLQSRETYQSQRQQRQLPEEKEVPSKRRFPELKEKSHDINEVLNRAHENKEEDDKDRVLRNTEYNIFKNIELQKELQKEDLYEPNNEDDLKDMIQTITDTSMRNKTEQYTSTGLFDHLKDEDTKIGELNNVQELIDEGRKTRNVSKNNVTNYDRSFFTSSLKLNKTDFIDFGISKKSKVFTTILIIILVIVMLVSAGILIKKMFF